METTLQRAQRYAALPEDILLVGPTGSGKGHLADYIHRVSGRTGDFVSISGGQLTKTLWSSQLFGHYAGAFTGARGKLKGSFEQATGGTLFLDELHHWSKRLQSALLRPLESRRFSPLGADRELSATCRIVFATTMCPDQLVEQEVLLPDLRYRLPALILKLPPLSARKDEILPLLDQFTARILASFKWEPARFRWAPSAVRGLLLHPWPGNIRQLERVVKRALAQAGPEPICPISVEDLELPLPPAGRLTALLDPPALQAAVVWALKQTDGARTEAADLLGIHRNTLATYSSPGFMATRSEAPDALLGGLGGVEGGRYTLPESA